MNAALPFPRPFRYLPFALHGAAWTLYLVMIVYVNTYQGTDFIVGHPGVHFFAQVAIFYFNYLYGIPVLLARNRTLAFISINLATIACLVMMLVPAAKLLREWYLGNAYTPLPLSLPEQLMLRFFELVFFMIIACMVRFSVDWFGLQRRTQRLENAQLQTELAFLRSQLNPHFLFNTLNSLYALAIRRAPETSEGIMQLSQLMRYMLYETNGGPVPLAREVEMITALLELQKLRLPLAFPAQFEIKGNIESATIEPLLLLPIIENMFKHGTGFVSIVLTISDQMLVLETQNGVEPHSKMAPGGIGLENLRKQLAFRYPARHTFATMAEPGIYRTKLSLNLNSSCQ